MRQFRILPALALAFSAPLLAEPGPAVSGTEIMVGDDLTGAFFATPEREGPFPAIILLGGSEGSVRGALGRHRSSTSDLASDAQVLFCASEGIGDQSIA